MRSTRDVNIKKLLALIWLLSGLYFVIVCIGKGSGVSAAISMICGFMVARNLANIVSL